MVSNTDLNPLSSRCVSTDFKITPWKLILADLGLPRAFEIVEKLEVAVHPCSSSTFKRSNRFNNSTTTRENVGKFLESYADHKVPVTLIRPGFCIYI